MVKKQHSKFKEPSKAISIKLNKIFGYNLRPKGFKESEFKKWGEFRDSLKLPFSDEDIEYICKLHSNVMNKQYYKPNKNNNQPLILMTDNLNKVYNSYDTRG